MEIESFIDALIFYERRKNMGTILKLNDLTKKYGNKVVVDNVNIEIEEGEIFGLLGPNGAGKSTTMNMVCDLVKPTLGNVEFFGKDFLEAEHSFGNHFESEAA